MINAEGQDRQHFQDLSESLFRLSACFCLFCSTSGDMRQSAIVYFTALMGMHRHALAFKSAYTYTPICSALIWVGRLLLLEHTLPLRLYEM